MATALRWLLGLALVAGHGCRTVRPEDVEEATAAASAVAAFPGAPALLSGFDLSGERGLRHGDRLLYGVTLHDGDRLIRRLLRIEVDRDDPELRTRHMTMDQIDPPRRLAARLTRPTGLLLLLCDTDGNEMQRSRIETYDAHLEENFVAAVLAHRGDDPLPVAVATRHLAEICNLLGSDAILKRLLGEVATVPFDLQLLWRRRLVLEPGFERATPVAAAAAAAAGADPRPAFDLPFDLYLNESLLVRCVATVTCPRGPTGATAGILRLSAQQAEQPGPRLELELLAAARGPRSDFAAHGAAAFLGYASEGVALAFSPDGRFVAMPGPIGVVELRDLRSEDPSVATELLGASMHVSALHFLDARTLLVARGNAIEVFACDSAIPGGSLIPAAVHAIPDEPGEPVAIEPADGRSLFIGFHGAAVERWTFTTSTAPPQRESVCGRTWERGRNFLLSKSPPRGWLLGGRGADRCLVRWTPFTEATQNKQPVETLYARTANGTWQATPHPLVAEPKARRQRWDGDGELLPWDEVAVGLMLSQRRDQTAHGAVSKFIHVTGEAGRSLGEAHAPTESYCHGFSPDGAFYACVGPGHRVLARVPGR